MRLLICNNENVKDAEAMCAMFAARKSIFIDLLRWNLPTHDDRYEVDQFDDAHARYLMVIRSGGAHAASARLLPTERPHILGTLFSHLCEEPVPQGPAVLEITRFCLDRDQHRLQRRTARNLLITALVDFAVAGAVTTYTGVAEASWFEQFCKFGWSCRALGRPQPCGSKALVAFRIDLDSNSVDRMIATGIYTGETHPTGLAA
jgi:N-acyl-L-homoserine lactone synthetase